MASEDLSTMEFMKYMLPIVGVIIGAAIPILKDWLSGRRAEKLERIKIHDSKKIEAYQKAYQFSSALRVSLDDNTQPKDLAFLNGNAATLYSVLENLPYFSPKVRDSLIQLEAVMESVMKNISDVENNSKLAREKVTPISNRLKNEILNDFRVWE